MGGQLRTVAVVLAGGVGARVGAGRPKQLIEVAGRTVLAHSIAAFDSHPGIAEVLVMMAAGHVDDARRIVRDEGFTKVTEVLEGGATRSASTARALDRLGDSECNVLLHDAARPLVSARIISDCIRALEVDRAVTVAIPASDTILEVSADGTVRGVPPRATLRRVQTPQGFRASVIRAAHARAAADPDFVATDDSSVVLRYLPEEQLRVVPGEDRNIKITEQVDVSLAEALFQESGRRRP